MVPPGPAIPELMGLDEGGGLPICNAGGEPCLPKAALVFSHCLCWDARGGHWGGCMELGGGCSGDLGIAEPRGKAAGTTGSCRISRV